MKHIYLCIYKVAKIEVLYSPTIAPKFFLLFDHSIFIFIFIFTPHLKGWKWELYPSKLNKKI